MRVSRVLLPSLLGPKPNCSQLYLAGAASVAPLRGPLSGDRIAITATRADVQNTNGARFFICGGGT
jgi:hypothetical protein